MIDELWPGVENVISITQTAPSEKQTQQRIKMSQALKDIQECM